MKKNNELQISIFRDLISKRLNPILLLDILGIIYKKNGNELISRCPHKDHIDKRESWSFNIKKKKHNCFSCGFSGGYEELVIEILDKTKDEAVEFLYDLVKENKIDEETLYDITIKQKQEDKEDECKIDKVCNLPKQFQGIKSRGNDYYKYLKTRGISDKYIKRLNIGYCEHYKSIKGELNFSNRIIIPIEFKNKLYTFFARNNDLIKDIDKKWRGLYPSEFKVGEILWPYDLIDYSIPYIILVEGPFDALRLLSLGYKNVLCYFGNKISDSQAKLIKNIILKMDNKCDVILIPDGDGELDIKISKKGINFKKSTATKGKLVILTFLKKLPGTKFYLINLPDNEDPGSIKKEILDSLIENKRFFKLESRIKTKIIYNIIK